MKNMDTFSTDMGTFPVDTIGPQKGLYYVPPTDEIFDEVKAAAIKLWKHYDNEFGYVEEKVERIKHIANIKDNVMYMVAMFDSENRYMLAGMLSEKAREAIRARMIDGGNDVYSIPF